MVHRRIATFAGIVYTSKVSAKLGIPQLGPESGSTEFRGSMEGGQSPQIRGGLGQQYPSDRRVHFRFFP